MKDRVGEKISSTEAAQKFYESEEYKKVEGGWSPCFEGGNDQLAAVKELISATGDVQGRDIL